MKAKFAKAIAENIATIAGNVAHVALIDAGAIPNRNRAEACAAVEKAKANIANLLQQPGAAPDAKD